MLSQSPSPCNMGKWFRLRHSARPRKARRKASLARSNATASGASFSQEIKACSGPGPGPGLSSVNCDSLSGQVAARSASCFARRPWRNRPGSHPAPHQAVTTALRPSASSAHGS